MPSSDGWYLAGPLVAFALLGLAALGLHRDHRRGLLPQREPYGAGLSLFREPEDFGLLSPAAIADDGELADHVRCLLSAAGIRSTVAFRPDGRICVLVFAEDVERARRLAGGSADRQ